MLVVASTKIHIQGSCSCYLNQHLTNTGTLVPARGRDIQSSVRLSLCIADNCSPVLESPSLWASCSADVCQAQLTVSSLVQ